MERIVLDTNVIISALLFDGVPEQVVLQVLSGSSISITSPFIIEETKRILQTKFSVTLEIASRLQQLLTVSEIQYFKPFLNIVTDEPDNRILETAVKGKANYLVTGDKLLLELKCHDSIAIVKPADFLSAR